MAIHTRLRTSMVGAAAVALLTPFLAVLSMAEPATAAVGPRPHEVYMYKVEKHVDLSGEYPDNYFDDTLSCYGNDIALDGMWRVDHVDQANPPETFGDERDVTVHGSYSDSVNPSTWHFEIENFADGNAQLKLWVTCIRAQTEKAHGHKHSIQLKPNYYVHSSVDPGGPFYYDECGPGYYAVAPGFHFVGAYQNRYNRIVGSWPTSSEQGWQWQFVVGDPSVRVDVAYRCLSDRVSSYGSPKAHTHELPIEWRPSSGGGGFNTHLTTHGMQDKQLSCDDGYHGAWYQSYKAMVGSFWIWDPGYVWFLGMDPRPKTRNFRFWYESGGTDISLGTLCIRSRTGKQIKP